MHVRFCYKIKKESFHCGSVVTNLTSILEVAFRSLASLSGLRIRHCCELWCRLQMQLGSGVTVPVAQPGSCSSDLTPSLGISICCEFGPKKQNKPKKKIKKKIRILMHLVDGVSSSLSQHCQIQWQKNYRSSVKYEY